MFLPYGGKHNLNVMRAYTLSIYRRQRGETLLEVLISVLVFSFGLVGLASLQISTMQKGRETTEHNIAMQLAGELVEQVRANPRGLELGWYLEPTKPLSSGCDAADCTLRSFTNTGLSYWQASINARLPGAQAQVCRDSSPGDGSPGTPGCDGSGAYTIKIWWPGQDGQLQRYQVQAGLL